MNCTRQEFENQVRAKYPHKWDNADVNPVNGYFTVFMLDTNAECQSSFNLKNTLASHIWEAGCVIKDTDNLFSTKSGVTMTTTGPTQMWINGTAINPIDWNFVNLHISVDSPTKTLKCECGAHTIGSNQHSSWCEIKE